MKNVPKSDKNIQIEYIELTDPHSFIVDIAVAFRVHFLLEITHVQFTSTTFNI